MEYWDVIAHAIGSLALLIGFGALLASIFVVAPRAITWLFFAWRRELLVWRIVRDLTAQAGEIQLNDKTIYRAPSYRKGGTHG